ncbi:unnamed protein product, partial [Candidula unifasciata]
MDDEEWKYASESRKIQEQSNSSRKARKAKSSGPKSKKKISKTLLQKTTHSTKAADDMAVGDRDGVEGVEEGEHVDVLRASIEENNVNNVREELQRDESPSKHSRSKSRSRSGSRSRFSNFFRRKKKCVSETDLTQNVTEEADKKYESTERVENTDRPKTLELRNDGEATANSSQRRSNLKRTSPHHSYDPRIQPRDRLLHMTVADAVKEQQLRRANSASRSSPRRRDTSSSSSAIMFLSSPSLAAAMMASDAARKAFRPTTTSSTLPAMRSKTPSAISSLVVGSSFPMSGFSMNLQDKAEIKTIQNEAPQPSIDNVNIEHARASKSDSLTHSIVEPQKQPRKDNINDFKGETSTQKMPAQEPTGETVRDSLSSQKDQPQPSHSVFVHRTPEEEALEAKTKRQASLSQFLELRQTLPPILTRTHRLSQSSDSGVTSRDTSPCPYPVYPEVKRQQDQHTSPPSQDSQLKDKAPNPYVVSSISVSPATVTSHSQSVSGEKIETGPKENEINRPQVLKLEDSMAESSSMSSSPQVNSMTSSFRSSDQGYAETDSDDESPFATPPEDFELTSSGKREKSRTFNPSILEKLLDTAREQLPREPGQKPDHTSSETKQQLLDRKFNILHDNQSTQELHPGEERGETKLRYIPRGVRRSQSDAESRHKTSRRFYKRTCKPDRGPQRIGSAEGFSTSPNLGREKVSFDLDKQLTPSTVTLTNSDGFDVDFLTVERNDQKLVPVMGTVAQQKYRRTYSPSRVRKIIPVSKDDSGTTPFFNTTAALVQSPVKEVISSVSATSMEQHPKSDLPEKPSNLPLKKPELSPTMPKRGILKSPLKDKVSVSTEDKENLQQPDSNDKPSLKPEPSQVNEQETQDIGEAIDKSQKIVEAKTKEEIRDDRISEIDISEEKTSKGETKKDKKLKKQKRKEKLPKSDTTTRTSPKEDIAMPTPTVQITFENAASIETPNNSLGKDFVPQTAAAKHSDEAALSKPRIEKSNSASDIIIHSRTQGISGEPSEPLTGSEKKLSIDFPMIHGLEVGMHKVHSFSGYSLGDYLKEQSKSNWMQQNICPKSQEVKAAKSVLKKKSSPSVEVRKQPNDIRTDKKEFHEQISKPTNDVLVTESKGKDSQSCTLKIMVDKECQTSAWLINTLIRKKSSKSKKKGTSFYKKKKQQQQRRGSSVSDTFVPLDLKRHKESFQHSSLGDIRLASSKEPSFTNRLVRGSSEKAPRHRVDKLSNLTPTAGSSSKSRSDNKNDDSDLPKPKKLSLSSVILLKNRLAKYREKKRTDKPSLETVEDEPGLDRVSSETLITMENELNLSKLEVSKETDIIDDDIYEPEFSLGYKRKHLRFEDLPSEPMQSQEPLPPLPTSRRMRQRRESTLRERKRKCVQYCKKFIAFLFSHVGLCSLVVAYTILGGFIFQALENQAEYNVRSSIR